MKYKTINLKGPEIGAWARHKGGALDDRKVAKIEGDQIWLELIGSVAGPFPAKNYTYFTVGQVGGS